MVNKKYSSVSTFQKVEQLIQLVERDDDLKTRINSDDPEVREAALKEATGLVGLEKTELKDMQDAFETSLGATQASVWVPTS